MERADWDKASCRGSEGLEAHKEAYLRAFALASAYVVPAWADFAGAGLGKAQPRCAAHGR